LIKRLLKNKKGTAEVVGSVLFIIILLFFFTNVYLWHDTATKDMNDMYVQKLNSPIAATVSHNVDGSYSISVTNTGGVDATLIGYWVNVKSASSPDTLHVSFPVNNVIAAAGGPPVPIPITYYQPGTVFKVITSTGNSASCIFPNFS
jgi:hypothetical protein